MAFHYKVIKTSATTYDLPQRTSSEVLIATANSGTQTFNLPFANLNGVFYTFVAADAGGEINIVPQASDSIVAKASEGGAVVAPAAGTGIKNTAATNVVGDRITLVADGNTGWYAVEQSGTWASL